MVRRLGLALACAAMFACGSSDSTGDGVPDKKRGFVPPPADSAPSAAPTTTGDPGATTGEPKGPFPLVFLHGMGGFEKLHLGPGNLQYWEGLREELAKDGEFQVFVTEAPPYDTSEVRAATIAKQIDDVLKQTGAPKVNLIGHSQGGLDARVIASPGGLGYGKKIGGVVTIATPHRGSRVADSLLGSIGGLPIDDVANGFLGLLQKTVYDVQSDANLRAQATELTESYMAKTFNTKFVDAPGVYYGSYGGRTNRASGVGACDGSVYPNEPSKLDDVQPVLFATAVYLENKKGVPNDGLVTVESAKWGEFLQCVPADHLKEIGMNDPAGGAFDHRALFRSVVKHLRSKGL